MNGVLIDDGGVTRKILLILLKKRTKVSNPSSHLSKYIRKLYVFKMKTFTFIYVVCTSKLYFIQDKNMYVICPSIQNIYKTKTL